MELSKYNIVQIHNGIHAGIKNNIVKIFTDMNICSRHIVIYYCFLRNTTKQYAQYDSV